MYTNLRFFLLIIIIVYCGDVSALESKLEQIKVETKNNILTLDLIKKIESNLTLPQNAFPLSAYIRYYAYKKVSKKQYIVAVFVRGESGVGRVEIIDFKNLPIIFDGGCDVIEVRYSLNKKKIISSYCHGYA